MWISRRRTEITSAKKALTDLVFDEVDEVEVGTPDVLEDEGGVPVSQLKGLALEEEDLGVEVASASREEVGSLLVKEGVLERVDVDTTLVYLVTLSAPLLVSFGSRLAILSDELRLSLEGDRDDGSRSSLAL